MTTISELGNATGRRPVTRAWTPGATHPGRPPELHERPPNWLLFGTYRASVLPPGARRENIAVVGSHLGLGRHPAVLWAVADRLAQPEQDWQPFRPPALLRALFPAPPEPDSTGR